MLEVAPQGDVNKLERSPLGTCCDFRDAFAKRFPKPRRLETLLTDNRHLETRTVNNGVVSRSAPCSSVSRARSGVPSSSGDWRQDAALRRVYSKMIFDLAVG